MITALLYITCLDCLYINIAKDTGYNYEEACPVCGGSLQIQKYDTNSISSHEELRVLHKEVLKLWADARSRHDSEVGKYIIGGMPPIEVENILPLTSAALEKINTLSIHMELAWDFMHQYIYPKYVEFPNPLLK
jgi:hypothetical protein